MHTQLPSSSDKSAPIETLIQQRRDKKKRLLELGKSPHGHRFQRTHLLGEVHQEFDSKIPMPTEGAHQPASLNLPLLKCAGRILTRRDLGKLCFAHIHDHTGKLQLKVIKQDLGEAGYKEFVKDVDLGDIIGVEGLVCRTKTGELSIQVKNFEILSKSLRPWPEKFHGVTDVETRARQRELDLATNPESRTRHLTRSRLIRHLRQTLDQLGFIEVETPLLQSVPGGAAAKPFVTHHEALDIDLYMRVAPELYLKRLLVGGLDKVYEIGRAFRNEGIDTRHNPEFTILEAYQAFGDVEDMMNLAEILIQGSAKVLGISGIDYRGEKCILEDPFQRLSLVDLFGQYLQLDLLDLCKSQGWRSAAKEKGLTLPAGATDRKCFDLLFDERILIHLNKPTFVLDYPSVFSPLAKTKPNQSFLADRFELFIAKEEVANAYTEQNDPDEQRKKFNEEQDKRLAGDAEAMPLDEDFIIALEHGMPPAGGLGIGIDRLTMLFTGVESIREVILFPVLRPQNE